MRRIICCLVTIGLTLTGLQAQEIAKSGKSRWGAGIFAGLNYTYPRVIIHYPAHFSPQTNLLLGVDLNYQLTARVLLHAQPSWTQIRNVSPNGFSRSLILNSTTVSIPLFYRYFVLPAHRSLFVEAGISYNRIVKSDYREDSGVVCITGPCPTVYTPKVSASTKSAVSGLAGVGVNIELHKISVPVTLRYERYVSSYMFPGFYERSSTPVQFENFSITTGVNF